MRVLMGLPCSQSSATLKTGGAAASVAGVSVTGGSDGGAVVAALTLGAGTSSATNACACVSSSKVEVGVILGTLAVLRPRVGATDRATDLAVERLLLNAAAGWAAAGLAAVGLANLALADVGLAGERGAGAGEDCLATERRGLTGVGVGNSVTNCLRLAVARWRGVATAGASAASLLGGAVVGKVEGCTFFLVMAGLSGLRSGS